MDKKFHLFSFSPSFTFN